jgi:AraC-like DNA-binding protein
MTRNGVLGTTSVRVQLTGFEGLGLDTARITAEAGLDEADLRNPDGVVPVSRINKMWEVAEREWGRPGLGLYAAGHVPFGACEAMDYLMASSATVADAISQLVDYLAILTRTYRYEIREDRDEPSCEMTWRIPPRGVMFHLRDFSLALAVGRIFRVSGHRPARVELIGPALATAHEYAEEFGAQAVIRAERNALSFSRATWRAALPAQDTMLNRTLRRHAQLLLDRHPVSDRATAADHVRAELLRTSHVGLASIDQVAGGLATTARTLQRQLRVEGVRFDDLRRDVRANLAQAYLGDRGLSISEVAYLIGFSESSAFSRAFRRWTGSSPQEFRRGHSG